MKRLKDYFSKIVAAVICFFAGLFMGKRELNKDVNKAVNKAANKDANKDINKAINKDVNKDINLDVNKDINKDLEKNEIKEVRPRNRRSYCKKKPPHRKPSGSRGSPLCD